MESARRHTDFRESLLANSKGFAQRQKVSRDGRRFLTTSEGFAQRQKVSRNVRRVTRNSKGFSRRRKISHGFRRILTTQESRKCVAVCVVSLRTTCDILCDTCFLDTYILPNFAELIFPESCTTCNKKLEKSVLQ